MKKLIPFFICICTLFSLAACKSTDFEEDSYSDDIIYDEEEPVVKKIESNDNYVADVDPVLLDELMLLTKSGSKLKAKEIRKVYFVPRNNNVELYFRDGVNEICLILEKAERDKILAACNQFLEEYDAKTLKHKKVNSKTAYYKSRCSLWFGIISNSTGSEKNEYFVNYEFIDKRPYLLIQTIPTRCEIPHEKDFTPKVKLYMSPSQIRDFIQQMNQENLESYLTETIEKAYTY